MSDLVIRERTEADLTGCVDALREVHVNDAYPISWPADPRAWITPDDLIGAWVADSPGAGIVGHVALTRNGGVPVAERVDALVSRLFVAPGGRRHRTGSRLLAHAQEWAAGKGLSLVLEVAELGDGAAIAFYERQGWVHVRSATATWTTPDGGPVTVRYYEPGGGPSATAPPPPR